MPLDPVESSGSHLPDTVKPATALELSEVWKEIGCVPPATEEAPWMLCEARGFPGRSPQHTFSLLRTAHSESKPTKQTAQKKKICHSQHQARLRQHHPQCTMSSKDLLNFGISCEWYGHITLPRKRHTSETEGLCHSTPEAEHLPSESDRPL